MTRSKEYVATTEPSNQANGDVATTRPAASPTQRPPRSRPATTVSPAAAEEATAATSTSDGTVASPAAWTRRPATTYSQYPGGWGRPWVTSKRETAARYCEESQSVGPVAAVARRATEGGERHGPGHQEVEYLDPDVGRTVRRHPAGPGRPVRPAGGTTGWATARSTARVPWGSCPRT